MSSFSVASDAGFSPQPASSKIAIAARITTSSFFFIFSSLLSIYHFSPGFPGGAAAPPGMGEKQKRCAGHKIAYTA